ncbi:B12-binding domain-containing protein [Sunxiuqinia elliptica]|uniref:Methanogenic corrinoid protein MtbC1 n=1 Tax=Sunxiuqinia elliptica TaxID=655355 RepID=A0A4R6GL79_9BACT|nr:cobalamin-dependent protein [Sunxiuqinia elliptica]TDN95901.1 methanogenic corrinoid protein MtbC1 [Sunxiuqinia elliptica]TDO67842.1 methanogenic corrinoid protein MtbC1 [Sunxiuqinia elliptica]
MKDELLKKLSACVEFGKTNKAALYPPQMKGEDGADEITSQLLDVGVGAQEILTGGLMPGMEKVGIKFRENKIFVPQVLMSAKAMGMSMVHLKPFFISGAAKQKGTFIIGTVQGDLHDIGKNLVAMMVEGSGYKVIDLGTDCLAEKYIAAIKENPGAAVGLSALLTTTMVNMEQITKDIKAVFPETLVTIGGAPVNDDFCLKIGADNYSADPQGVVDFLNTKIA